jgi:ethanolamine phosphate phosphodiesterase
VQLFEPDIVFILGDVFDEGNWVNDKQFQEYVDRFKSIFYVPQTTRVYAIAGNHDVNFHYNMHPHLVKRFDAAFNSSGVALLREEKVTSKNYKRYVNFITLNSMAMEGDSCDFCIAAKESLKFYNVRLNQLKEMKSYSQPFVLQHFPTYRESDANCEEKNSENTASYREKWEALSKESSDYLENLLQPRGYFSGHTHHYCKYKKKNNYEYTLASFNWRNINNPSFLLAIFTPDDYSVEKCDMPKESTVILCYVIGSVLSIISAFFKIKLPFLEKSKTS